MSRVFVDGGYVSWTYGVDGMKINAFQLAKRQWNTRQGGVFLMDSDTSFREEYDPSYKSRRRENYEEKPERVIRKQRVDAFKEVIREDGSLTVKEIPGLEADDLVALYAMDRIPFVRLPIEVIGADKDLLQLKPYVDVRHVDGTWFDVEDYAARLPKALQPHVTQPEHILLCLVFMGDHSDSVERLIPPRRLDIMKEILAAPEPWRAGLNLVDPGKLKRNLYLTVLPGPWVADPRPTEDDVFTMVNTGCYRPEIRSKLRRSIIESLAIDYVKEA